MSSYSFVKMSCDSVTMNNKRRKLKFTGVEDENGVSTVITDNSDNIERVKSTSKSRCLDIVLR